MPLEFSKSTNSEHKEKLDPKLVFCAWTDGAAFAGQKARFEIGTSFVGHGAPVKVTGKSAGGKKLGKVSGKIRANGFSGAFDIPEDTEVGDTISFKVELSKNGLSGESEFIPVFPKVTVSKMKWSAEEARRGDVLTLKADVRGPQDGTPATVIVKEFDTDGIHDRIAEIATTISGEKVEINWQYEYHDDTDEIPTDEEMNRYGRSYSLPEYFFTIKVGSEEFGLEQESGLLTFKDTIEIFLRGRAGGPIGNEDCVVHLADGTQREETLGEDGRTVIEDLPPGPVTIEFPNYPNVRRVSEGAEIRQGLRRRERVPSGGRYVFEPVPFDFSE